jgi:hypothetical protein
VSLHPSPLVVFPSSHPSAPFKVESQHTTLSVISNVAENKIIPSSFVSSHIVNIRSPTGSSVLKSLKFQAGLNVHELGVPEGSGPAASSNVTVTLGAFASP